MPLKKYEDFLDMNIKDLQDYLAVRGLNTSARKIELIARFFVAFELKIEIKSTFRGSKEKSCDKIPSKHQGPFFT